MNKRRGSVVRFRKKRNINVGVVIFSIIFIYLVSYLVIYISRDRISIYEVVYGKNSESSTKTYTCLAVRDEEVYKSKTAGYLNLFVREGEKTAVGQIVYSIDETGATNELLKAASSEDNSLSKNDLLRLKERVINYTTTYNGDNFERVYSFKDDVEATVNEYINLNIISNLDEILLEEDTSSTFKTVKAKKSGVVSYTIDGYEGKIPQDLKTEDFEKSSYKKKSHKSSDLVKKGTEVYKVVNSENWVLLIPFSDDEIDRYKTDSRLQVKFIKDKVCAYGDFTIKYIDNKPYGYLELDQYMIRYVNDRFLEIQIVDEEMEGLKIPKTSIVEKEFYTVPMEYATKGGNSGELGFLVEVYDENANITTKFIAAEIYGKNETDYYVSKDDFGAGNVLMKPDSTEIFTISSDITLKGVYNINNGYCIFREVVITGETSDYYIVKSGTTYGLLVYDHIVLDSSKVAENQIVYQ